MRKFLTKKGSRRHRRDVNLFGCRAKLKRVRTFPNAEIELFLNVKCILFASYMHLNFWYDFYHFFFTQTWYLGDGGGDCTAKLEKW